MQENWYKNISFLIRILAMTNLVTFGGLDYNHKQYAWMSEFDDIIWRPLTILNPKHYSEFGTIFTVRGMLYYFLPSLHRFCPRLQDQSRRKLIGIRRWHWHQWIKTLWRNIQYLFWIERSLPAIHAEAYSKANQSCSIS